MEQLQELLSLATERNLTPEELVRLAHLAVSTNSVERTVSCLLMGGSHATFNLRSCPELVRQYKKIAKVRSKNTKFRSRTQDKTFKPYDILITSHAVERFVKRWGVPAEDAEKLLCEYALNATPLSTRTRSGQEQWLCENGAVLVVKRDKRLKIPVCVTVLPAPEESDIYPERNSA